jgi:hypothetical protein
MPPKSVQAVDEMTVAPGPRRPNLLVMHGVKGGIGKSSSAALSASAALKKGLKVHVIETDSGVPDVAPRFLNAHGASVSAIALDSDIEASETLSALLSSVEALVTASNPPDLIVINSPAGSTAVLDGFADIFATVATSLDLDLTVCFLIDDTAAVMPKIEASISTGLLSIASARRALVYTGWKGSTESFPVSNSSARAAALAAGVVEHVFPGLNPPTLLETVKKSDRPMFDLLDPAVGLKIVERSLLSRWFKAAEPMTDWLIGE